MSIEKWEEVHCDRTEQDLAIIPNCLLKRSTDMPNGTELRHSHYFNGSSVMYKGITLFAYRSEQKPYFENPLVHICQLRNHGLPVGQHFTFKPNPPKSFCECMVWKRKKMMNRHTTTWRAEDPRLHVHGDDLYMIFTDGWKIGYCKIDVKVDGEKLEDLTFGQTIYPPPPSTGGFTGYDGREKNWSPVSFDGDLWVLYSFQPMIFYRLRDGFVRHVPTNIMDDWKYGFVKGGTPLVQMDNGNYITLFHSTVVFEWKDMRHYFAGAMVFDKHLIPIAMSRYPLVAPAMSKEPNNYLKECYVVFPAGLYRHDGKWYSTCGINDEHNRLFIMSDEMLEHNLGIRV